MGGKGRGPEGDRGKEREDLREMEIGGNEGEVLRARQGNGRKESGWKARMREGYVEGERSGCVRQRRLAEEREERTETKKISPLQLHFIATDHVSEFDQNTSAHYISGILFRSGSFVPTGEKKKIVQKLLSS